jgi:tRNA threonylcarbamoyladenosine biosynthesis protein TsaB
VSGLVLAIECSQREGGVSVGAPDGEPASETLRAGARHDDDLLPAIDRLLGRAGAGPASLEAVGVSIGPGGFTGLRIAVSTARALADVLGVKLLAIPSAEVVAASEPGPGPIVVALAGKSSSFWSTRLVRAGDAWRVEHAGLVEGADVDLSDLEAVVADAYLPETARRRCAALGLPIREPRFDPAACWRLACGRLARGETSDPLELLPLYPRPPSAVLLRSKGQSDPPRR